MDSKGRYADKPSEIGGQGWKDIAYRVWKEVGEDRLGFVAAAIAFYLLMALVPLLAAIVGIYGVVADPSDVARHLDTLAAFLPQEMVGIVGDELSRIISDQDRAGLSIFLGLLLSIWGGTKATDALMIALNIAYDEEEGRHFLKRKLISLGLTLGSILFLLLVLALLAGLPTLINILSLSSLLEGFIEAGRWPLLFLFSMLWVSALYRFATCRSHPEWEWVSWGAFLATLLWVIGSALLSFYAAHFGRYSATYGSLGAIVVTMLWFYISGFAVMLGAEINAEMEHQTKRDTTIGPDQPLGSRGAYVADTVGESHGG